MARLPESELNQLKETISLLRLVESQGYTLKKQGKDFVMCCPFHDDKTPSLAISPNNNLFHCFGCGAAGSVIDWVMKTQGVSFVHAVEILKQDRGLATANKANPGSQVKRSKKSYLPPLVAEQIDKQLLLQRVMAYYHTTLKHSPEALAYLAKRGLNHPELIDTFKLGFANKTLTYRLPASHTQLGQTVRQQLRELGILRATGHEHFNGSLVIPIHKTEDGGQKTEISEVYGRKIAANNKLAKGSPRHVYLPGAHSGVWNSNALATCDELILCEALIDAMTFWVHGYRNVTSSYGVSGFTDNHLAAFKHHGIKQVLIAYDRDKAGDTAADKLAKRLNDNGIDAFRLLLPNGMDVNSYALEKTEDTEQKTDMVERLGKLIRNAQWLGNGQPPTLTTDKHNHTSTDAPPHLADNTDKSPSPAPAQASPLPPTPEPIEAVINEHAVTLTFGQRHYRIRGLAKNLSHEHLKVTILVSLVGEQHTHLHSDTFDLYQSRPRHSFIHQAAVELGLESDIIKTDMGKVLLKLETLQAQQIQHTLQPKDKTAVELSDDEQQQALALLKDKDLLTRILADFNTAGIIGEDTNKLVGYLACVSRQLEHPLAIIIQSSSAAGKSSLMEAILNFIPEEYRTHYSAMTGQSLFYMGETNLKHKILAIAEQQGAEQASYALKLLQSEGELTIASTGKDEATGNLVTKAYRVEGPVMLFLTTTAIDIDEELMNRCIVLTVNETRAQTQAIHQMQRSQQTLTGLLQHEDKKQLITLHRNAQRLLRPLLVANPFAEQLTFLNDKTRTRRDHMKYLTLIRSIALLHQYQREVKTVHHNGQRLEYIEVEPADIDTANQLAHEVLGRSLDELPPQTRALLKQIYQMVQAHCQQQAIEPSHYRFSRKDIRTFTHWSDGQLKIHCSRLTELEYLLVHRGGRGQSIVYELLYDGHLEADKKHMMGLINPDILNNHAQKEGLASNTSGQTAQTSPPSQRQVSPKLAASQGKQNRVNAITTALNGDLAEKAQTTHYKGKGKMSTHAMVV